ncbi:lambda ning protein [Caudoviricetes sp.]|nr:lambda ning protein [Caudoviricetes sp.]
MLRKYGEDVVNDLESREFESKSWTEEELIAIKEYYRDKIRRIERGEPPEEVPDYSGMAVLDMFTSVGETGEV